MTKPITSLYGDRAFYTSYRKRVNEKLGVSLSARIFELCQKDNEALGGKPDVSPLLTLQNRLQALTRQRLEFDKLVDEKTRQRLISMAENDYHISFKPPQAAKTAIAAMVQDFRKGKINENPGDFQLFIGHAENTIEYHTVLNAISSLRSNIYSGEELQDTLKAIEGCLDKLGDEGPAMREKLLEAAKAAPDADALAKFLKENLSPKGIETLKHLNPAAKKLLLEEAEPDQQQEETATSEAESGKEDGWEGQEDEEDEVNEEYDEWLAP